jgi:Zn-finger nucleic acid-binding protein
MHNPYFPHDYKLHSDSKFATPRHEGLPDVELSSLYEPACVKKRSNVISSAPDISNHRTACMQCGGTTREVPGRQYLQCVYCQSLVFPHGSPLTTDGITPVGGELAALCPCCSDILQTGELDGHKALYCRRCYGILVRNAAFGEVVRDRRAARGPHDSQGVRPIDTTQYERTLQCPSCRNRMETHPYYGPGNVVIDSCSDCGYVWLDHGELATLERAAGRPEPKLDPLLLSGASVRASQHLETPKESPLATLLSLLF